MLKEAAIKQLQSLQFILSQIREEDYQTNLKTLKEASIGKHVRHIIEFYQCLLLNPIDNVVNYDNRKRNSLLEENVKYTYDYITEIIDILERIQINKQLILVSNYQNQDVRMESSLYREITTTLSTPFII